MGMALGCGEGEGDERTSASSGPVRSFRELDYALYQLLEKGVFFNQKEDCLLMQNNGIIAVYPT